MGSRQGRLGRQDLQWPQSGIIVWDDPALTEPLTHAIFPVLVATHQVKRVATLAASAAELLAFGREYMAQIMRNAQALGAALSLPGSPCWALSGQHPTNTPIWACRATFRLPLPFGPPRGTIFALRCIYDDISTAPGRITRAPGRV